MEAFGCAEKYSQIFRKKAATAMGRAYKEV
jgi:hypothetical protein